MGGGSKGGGMRGRTAQARPQVGRASSGGVARFVMQGGGPRPNGIGTVNNAAVSTRFRARSLRGRTARRAA